VITKKEIKQTRCPNKCLISFSFFKNSEMFWIDHMDDPVSGGFNKNINELI